MIYPFQISVDRGGQIFFQAPDRAREKMGAQNQSTRLIETTKNIVFYSLLPKAVQKNMLKAWDFTKNKFCHRCFDNNLQKIFRTNILENDTGQILLIVVLIVR